MNFVRWFEVIALACLAVASASAQTPAAPKKLSPDEMLGLRVAECSTFEVSEEPDECVRLNNTAQGLLTDALGWLKIPWGIALPPADAPGSRLVFHPADLSVRSILDSVVAADPRYKWDVKGGVINLLPEVDSPPLLDVGMAEFRQEEVPVKVMFEALENMPEVRRRAAELGFSESRGGFVFQIGPVDTRRFSVRCQNCTVLEALNAIAREAGSFWVYKNITMKGRRPTASSNALLNGRTQQRHAPDPRYESC